MLVSPSKILKNRILKNRTLNFETVRRTHGNMVFVPSFNRDDLIAVLKSTLFRPTQLMSIYTPRIIRMYGRPPLRVDQKEYYLDMKAKTDGRMKYGKITLNTYAGKNLVYDISTELKYVYDNFKEIRHGRAFQKTIFDAVGDIILQNTNDPDYQDNFIVFPMLNYIENFKSSVDFKIDVYDPMILFLRSLKEGTLENKFKNINYVIFYNINADALVCLDLKEFNVDDDYDHVFHLLMRLNNFNGHTDNLDDIDDNDSDLDEDDKVENKKEEIKNAVLSKVAKELKIKNLTDFEAANKSEKDLILLLDREIEKYIDDPANIEKSFADLVDSIEKNPVIKRQAIQYVESKNIGLKNLNTLSKNLEKEITTLQDIAEIETVDALNEPDIFEVDIPDFDDRVKESHLSSLDEQYNIKQSRKDLINVVSGFSSSEYLPLAVDNIDITDTSDDFTKKETVKVRYRTPEGKYLSFGIDVPKFIDKKYMYLSGNKKVIKKQILRLPIIKTKYNRVEITTNYNKMTIERSTGNLSRRNQYLLKIIAGFKANPDVNIVYGDNAAVNFGTPADFEWEELSSSLTSLIKPPYKILFNIKDISATIETLDVPDDLPEDMYPIGFVSDIMDMSDEKKVIYIQDGKIRILDIASKKIEDTNKNLLEYIVSTVLGTPQSLEKLPPISKSYLYTNVTFLAETYPVFTLVASSNGLSDILKRYKVKYYESVEPKKNPSYVEVKFKDKYLYFEDIPKNNLLLNAIFTLKPEEYTRDAFDLAEPYTDYFISRFGKAIGTYSRNRIKINLDMMIDPITRDVLKDLRMPTDIIDVLLQANTLLVGNTYQKLYDLRTYRIRGNEVVNARLYKIIASAYVKYLEHHMNGNPINLEIPKGVLISTLQQDPNVNDHSLLNPIRELEDVSSASAKGFNGVNINQAYTLEMRLYNETMQGVLSGNATPFSGQSGITRTLTVDPKINTVRGFVGDIDQNSLNAANILSPVEMMSPFTACSADPTRSSMQVSQTKHTMPVRHAHKQLIGSGANKTMAYMISDDFCFKAKKSGVVELINEKEQLVVLRYDDGTKDAIDIKEVLVKNSNSGFFIKQQFVPKYKEGEHFAKGDVLAYNPSFFSGKGKNVDYMTGTLAKIAIAPFDLAFEDANIVTEMLSKKCTADICMCKDVVLGRNAVVSHIVEEGDNIMTGDHLIDFTSSFDDPAIEKFLSRMAFDNIDDLTAEHVSSKYTGEITQIKIYYNVPFEELSSSLQKIINKYKNRINSRRSVISGINTDSVHIPPVTQISGNKVGNIEFDGVLIQFYVTYEDDLAMGDKIAFTTALKGVVSKLLSKEEAPTSEYRPEDKIEAIMTPTGIISRMTADIYPIMYSNKVLVELGKQIKEIYES